MPHRFLGSERRQTWARKQETVSRIDTLSLGQRGPRAFGVSCLLSNNAPMTSWCRPVCTITGPSPPTHHGTPTPISSAAGCSLGNEGAHRCVPCRSEAEMGSCVNRKRSFTNPDTARPPVAQGGPECGPTPRQRFAIFIFQPSSSRYVSVVSVWPKAILPGWPREGRRLDTATLTEQVPSGPKGLEKMGTAPRFGSAPPQAGQSGGAFRSLRVQPCGHRDEPNTLRLREPPRSLLDYVFTRHPQSRTCSPSRREGRAWRLRRCTNTRCWPRVTTAQGRPHCRPLRPATHRSAATHGILHLPGEGEPTQEEGQQAGPRLRSQALRHTPAEGRSRLSGPEPPASHSCPVRKTDWAIPRFSSPALWECRGAWGASPGMLPGEPSSFSLSDGFTGALSWKGLLKPRTHNPTHADLPPQRPTRPVCPAWTPAGTGSPCLQGPHCVLAQLYSLCGLQFAMMKLASLELPLRALVPPQGTPGRSQVSSAPQPLLQAPSLHCTRATF